MAHRITVVLAQGQSHHPAKKKLEEEIVSQLLCEPSLEVVVVSHLYDLSADGPGMLCLQGIAGDMIVLSWMYPRAARWTLARNAIQGQEGLTLLTEQAEGEKADEIPTDNHGEDAPHLIDSLKIPLRKIYCLDLRLHKEAEVYLQEIRRISEEAKITTIEPALGNITGDASSSRIPKSNGKAPGKPVIIKEETKRRWYPVIDMSRCTNCMECIDFCLFGVYGVDRTEMILVEQPDDCRKGCPACARVCPENAILFPQHKTPAIAGSQKTADDLKIDLSKLFGAMEPVDAMDLAIRERDEELMLTGREVVGRNGTGNAMAEMGTDRDGEQPAQHTTEKDDLDHLMDQLDQIDL